MKTIDPKTMTVEELKAMAYDVLTTIQQQQNNLNALNAEIEKKSSVKVEKK